MPPRDPRKCGKMAVNWTEAFHLKFLYVFRPQIRLLHLLLRVSPQGEGREPRPVNRRCCQETWRDVEQHLRRGQAALREESRQAEGEVRKGKTRRDFLFCPLMVGEFAFWTRLFFSLQDIAAYRAKGKTGGGAPAKAPTKAEKKMDDDDDDDDDEEEEEEDDDEEDDE